jgi:hypothetical protein
VSGNDDDDDDDDDDKEPTLESASTSRATRFYEIENY